ACAQGKPVCSEPAWAPIRQGDLGRWLPPTTLDTPEAWLESRPSLVLPVSGRLVRPGEWEAFVQARERLAAADRDAIRLHRLLRALHDGALGTGVLGALAGIVLAEVAFLLALRRRRRTGMRRVTVGAEAVEFPSARVPLVDRQALDAQLRILVADGHEGDLEGLRHAVGSVDVRQGTIDEDVYRFVHPARGRASLRDVALVSVLLATVAGSIGSAGLTLLDPGRPPVPFSCVALCGAPTWAEITTPLELGTRRLHDSRPADADAYLDRLLDLPAPRAALIPQRIEAATKLREAEWAAFQLASGRLAAREAAERATWTRTKNASGYALRALPYLVGALPLLVLALAGSIRRTHRARADRVLRLTRHHLEVDGRRDLLEELAEADVDARLQDLRESGHLGPGPRVAERLREAVRTAHQRTDDPAARARLAALRA
ncbi:MAG: hypothetical protein KC656_22975, partial [Myxococcales bacterium]|nr:hypothetical protein [Myxococcales bacterium]